MGVPEENAVSKEATPNGAANGHQEEALPSYQPVAEQQPAAVHDAPQPLPDISLGRDFAEQILREPLKDGSQFYHTVSEGVCLVHLKLLHAIQNMKEDVGYTDGLFGIWDSLVTDSKGLAFDSIPLPAGTNTAKMTEDDKRQVLLSKLREKRWAIFVARAVDRYETWWASQGGIMLTEDDMSVADGSNYMRYPSAKSQFVWKVSMLPPLGMLLSRPTKVSKYVLTLGGRRAHGHAYTYA